MERIARAAGDGQQRPAAQNGGEGAGCRSGNASITRAALFAWPRAVARAGWYPRAAIDTSFDVGDNTHAGLACLGGVNTVAAARRRGGENTK